MPGALARLRVHHSQRFVAAQTRIGQWPRVFGGRPDPFAPILGVAFVSLERPQQEQQRGPFIGAVFCRDGGIANDGTD
jgi:hypothetical protein